MPADPAGREGIAGLKEKGASQGPFAQLGMGGTSGLLAGNPNVCLTGNIA